MFANEDFDLDEDFLNDISQKESQYYSQTLSSDDESRVKRFKNDENSSGPSCSERTLEYEKPTYSESKKDLLLPNTNDIGDDKTVRKNLILERLNRRGNNVSEPSIRQDAGKLDSRNSNLEKSNLAEASFRHPANNESRKTLISERFRKNNVGSIPSSSSFSPAENCQQINLDKDIGAHSKSEQFKTAGKSPLKSAKQIYTKSVTLVRQFPGPAGLLPDSPSGIVPPLIPDSLCFDDSNDATESEMVDNSSVISKYCSQNTTNAFAEGAWQSLISDLSPDFLNGHEISTIQQNLLTNSYKRNKVPYLAGIVQQVDFTCQDPLVVLKDSTGTIEGTVCKDILVEYPHCLDIGVVLFLGNVGLLTIGNYLKKCHVIVTLKNILNIYTSRARIFNVSEMEVRLKNLNNRSPLCESANRVSNSARFSHSKFENGSNFGREKTTENRNSELGFNHLENSSSNHAYRPIVAGEISPVTHKNFNPLVSKTSTNKCSNVSNGNRKNLNSFPADTNSNKLTFESGDLEDFDDDFAASFLDIDDNLLPESSTNIGLDTNCHKEKDSSVPRNGNTVISEKSSVPDIHKNTNLSQETANLVLKVSDVFNESTENSEATDREPTSKEKSNRNKTSDIRLKLSVFRSKTELTQSPCEDLDFPSTEEIVNENKEHVKSSSTSGFVFNDENDSDEELFSQLDVESIISRYNKD